MSPLQFPYLRFRVTPETITPARYVYRPVIAVRLAIGRRTIKFEALIDSGADHCTFPGWIAQRLGRDVHQADGRLFKGIGGQVVAYRHPTRITVGDVAFRADVYYAKEWDEMPFVLLGQTSLFSRFDIHFQYRRKAIKLIPVRENR